MKFTSWAFLAFVGSLIFLALFIKDQEIKMGVDRLRKLNASPRSVLEADPNLRLVSEPDMAKVLAGLNQLGPKPIETLTPARSPRLAQG